MTVDSQAYRIEKITTTGSTEVRFDLMARMMGLTIDQAAFRTLTLCEGQQKTFQIVNKRRSTWPSTRND